jgi:hypothetical protein
MSDHPGFRERLSRREYDHPVTFNLIVFSVLIALTLAFREYPIAVVWVGLMGFRLWGMRQGGHIRGAMQRRYGWK